MNTSFEARFAYSDFVDSAEERLNRLKQLLDFKYEPSSIWKELLQNAEDCGARQLHFAVLPAPLPDPKFSHPFLGVPLLCALNDGAFSTQDAHAIARMGLGTKGADEDAIGKFGLGMKSVFNLGEVLFYFASPDQEASLEQHAGDPSACFGQALNPYKELKGLPQHAEWRLGDNRTFGALMRRLLERVRAQRFCQALEKGEQKRWFALVLPLRDTAIAPRERALVQNYPAPGALFPADLEERLVSLFPMLRSLESVSVWREENAGAPNPWVRVTLQEGARRPQKPTTLRERLGVPCGFGGTLRALGPAPVRRFEGQEIRLDMAEFADTGIQERSQNLFVRVEGQEQAQLRREKFAPHAAAAWLGGAPDGVAEGVLRVRPAVALPLPDQRDLSGGRSNAQDIPAPGAPAVQLTLHGNFFIDDGRRNLVLNAHNAEGELPQSRWNKQLLAQGTLPLVLPALAAWLGGLPAGQKPGEVAIRELTRALHRVQWFVPDAPAALTARGNWLYRLSGPPAPDLTVSALKRRATQKSAQVGAWQLEEGDAFRVLPAPPEGEAAGALDNAPAKVFEWLPALATLAKKQVLTWDWPRWVRAEPGGWNEEEMLALLRGSSGEAWFQSPVAARYLLALGHSFGAQLPDAVWARVLELAVAGLRAFPFGARLKDEIVGVWREFWAWVPRRFWLPFEIGTKEDRERRPTEAKAFLGALLDLRLERLPVPTDLAPALASSPVPDGDEGRWHFADAQKVARLFADWGARPAEGAGALARPNQLLDCTAGTLDEKFEALGAFALWKTKEWRSNQKPTTGVLRSWQELRELREERRLWVDVRDGGADWLRDWCRAVDVSRPTPDGGQSFIVSLEEGADRPLSRALWPRREEQPQSFGAKACLDLLGSRPVLREPKERAALVPRLFDALKADRKPENRRAVRFLLHGSAEHFGDETTPLLQVARGGEVWHQLALSVLPPEQRWTPIPGELSKQIADDTAALLEVRALDKGYALERLRAFKGNLAALSLNFTPDERRLILRDLSDNPNDQALFRALPLHEVRHGMGTRPASLPAQCFLEGALIPLPPELRASLCLVARPADLLLRARYEGFGIGEFEAQSVLELALCHAEPHRFTATILDTLEALDPAKIRPAIHESLRAIPWLHVVGRGAFAPAKVVHLPAIGSDCEAICKGSETIAAPEVERAWGTHPAWKKVSALWPDALESAVLLRAELGGAEAGRGAPHHRPFALGALSFGAAPHAQLARFLDGWRASGAELPPGVALLLRLRDKGQSEAACEIAPALFAPIPVESLVKWGRAVSLAAQGAPDADRGNPVVALHFWLFEAFTRHPDARQEHLHPWVLPSHSGAWKAPDTLTLTRAASGVQKEALLHPVWAGALDGNAALCRAHPTKPRPAGGDAWRELERELSVWNVPDALKGALVAVLGAPPKEAARSDGLCRAHFEGAPDARLRVWELLGGHFEGAPHDLQVSGARPFYFSWVDGVGTVEAAHLLGETARFPLEESDFASLIAGNIEEVEAGWRVQLRRMQGHPKRDSRANMADLLGETLRVLLRKRDEFAAQRTFVPSDDQHQGNGGAGLGAVGLGERVFYRLGGARLEACLAQWTRAEQVDLEVAQSFMVDNAFLYFRTLGGHMGRKTTEIVRDYDAWRTEQHSRIEVTSVGGSAAYKADARSGGEGDRQSISARLRDMAQNDSVFQGETLAMVRQKILDCGYDAASLPFELFQNADDAASERHEAGLGDAQTARLLVTLDLGDARATWTHFGRKMNVKGAYGVRSVEETGERGYGRDLEKMLILQASDKAGQSFTTGKFGLGFKSVYLVAERPTVESGELRFEVRGGFYPHPIGADGALERDATRITFGFTRHDPREVFGLFWRVLPLQLVFGRTLRECDFRFDAQTFHFKPQVRGLHAGARVVSWGAAPSWPLGADHAAPLPAHLLVLGTEGEGLLALGLGARGVEKLPPDIPCLWATTPTRVPVAPGFALGAPWQLDVGRVQLAGGAANQTLARDLGATWRAHFEKLLAHSGTWENVREALGLDAGVSRAEFWRGVAALFAVPVVQNDPLLRLIFARRGGVLAALEEFWPAPVAESAQSDGDEEAPRAALTSVPDFAAIHAWWQEERPRHFPTREGPFFPSGLPVYEGLTAKDERVRRRAWLALLLRASLEGVGRTTPEQKREFIGMCAAPETGWLDQFAAPAADVSRLGRALEAFLERDADNHKHLHLLRHSLPVFALARWLEKYIAILSRLDARKKWGDISFLRPRTDSGYGLLIDVPDAPQLGHVLGVGAHFLLRELVRAGVVADKRAYPLCFHPTASLRRALEPLDARFASPTLNSLDASKLAHTLLLARLGERAHFDLDFDIPLVLWAQGGAETPGQGGTS